MPIYSYPASIYLSDYEYYELLSSKNVPFRNLLRLARKRGYIFSEKSLPDDVRNFLTNYPSDWATVTDILAKISKPDPEEHTSSLNLDNCEKDISVAKLVKTIQESRTSLTDERISHTKKKGVDYIEVSYVERDYTKALIYTRRKKVAKIEIKQEGQSITLLYSACDKGRAIVETLAGKISPAPNETIVQESVSLLKVTDKSLRSRFFTKLAADVPGYRFLSASQVSVERRLPEDDSEKDAGSEDEPSSESADDADNGKELVLNTEDDATKFPGSVDHVTLHGQQVLSSRLYNEAVKAGYYIYNLRWTVRDKSDDRFEFEFEAGFDDAIYSTGFRFEVHRKRHFTGKGASEWETVPLTVDERRNLLLKLDQASRVTLASILTKPKGKKKKAT